MIGFGLVNMAEMVSLIVLLRKLYIYLGVDKGYFTRENC